MGIPGIAFNNVQALLLKEQSVGDAHEKMKLVWDVTTVSDLFMAFCSVGVLSLLKLSTIPCSIHALCHTASPHTVQEHSGVDHREPASGTGCCRVFRTGFPHKQNRKSFRNISTTIRILNGNVSIAHNHSLIRNPCCSLLHQTFHKCAWGESCWVSWFRPVYAWSPDVLVRPNFSQMVL